MEIRQVLLRFKHQILFALALAFTIIFICYLAPRFVDILKYFWPLLVSTALFLFASVVFDRISPVTDDSGEKPGEGLLDFVSGEPPVGEMETTEGAAEVEESLKAE
ncbi:DNA-directed RNA polymerase subunit beta [Striga asiatica]|uniref:DNA-directed RNA polymerase subunit beta n=1 Tax=Striga asiatica TaxID=4170 RepID=A0A5A7QNE1_STRAF|nr:DNA-directed RNA polymerase subunit beta [Striga asiatica]